MALVLDTADLPRRDREEAVFAAMLTATPACRLAHWDPEAALYARIDLWDFGGVSLWRHEGSGVRMTRTAAHIRQDAPEIAAIALQEFGRARRVQAGHTSEPHRNALLLSDLTAPYDYAWSGVGAASALSIPYDRLGLPVDLVRRAAPLLHTSSLYGFVRDQLSAMAAAADTLAADPGAAALGEASVSLVRALLASAAHDDRRARPALAETLPVRIHAYIDQHLRDPLLRPASIAAAHSISLRQLYREVQPPQLTLEQWIISRRLEGARADLVRPENHRRPVAEIARSWGFADPSHFGRRFRAAYGLTPRHWRRMTAAQAEAQED
ncbi:helix-turn-helix domain-containing protein [Streptomyces poriferorum]|uniref:Helix-turn-helix domain-containing protein n=1 Tax=Streptomyces poriferorum TaxID=2798799 RepID=A0ABY9IJ70_9ACTN|nr:MULTISPECIES: helix-turn-helix domain-containing protein [unclassified Streptomyces]MDP5317041.1 helix-turn-helix domain-containing protein [Streptomyces sp. Alt4]WLQ55313.1 helix-turn-helix domain-containing protein [Streptomyces sp. Alt2]